METMEACYMEITLSLKQFKTQNVFCDGFNYFVLAWVRSLE